MDLGGGRTPRPAAALLAALGAVVFVIAVYGVVVVGGGLLLGVSGASLPLAVLATAVVAVTLDPVRRLLSVHLAPSPDTVLADFTNRLSGPREKEALGAQMARLLAEGTSARRVEVWLYGPSSSGTGRQLIGRWPVDAAPIDPAAPDVHDHPLEAGDQPLGRILRDCPTGRGAASGTTSPVEHQLLDDLLAAAVQALRPLALTADLEDRVELITAQAAELRASRARVVAAADAARQRVERDIHDGAQQHLVALALKLSLAVSVAGRDPRRAGQLIADLRPVVEAAQRTLSDLSRGIYPTLLTERGIGPALRTATVTSPVPVWVRDDTGRRFPAAVEAAVYFAALEAVQNALKHARAGQVVVRLRVDAGTTLVFAVENDGTGLDAPAADRGTGLRHVRDRVESLGGWVCVMTSAGGGTTVTGAIPDDPPEHRGDR